MSKEQITAVFDKLQSLDVRVRALEIRIAFGAGIIVAAQVVIGVWL